MSSKLESDVCCHLVRATKVNAGLAESNGRLLLGIWRDSLHVTCGLTACTPGSAPGPMLGNEYGKNFTFYPHHSVFFRPDALPAAQPTASKHWRHKVKVRLTSSGVMFLAESIWSWFCKKDTVNPMICCLNAICSTCDAIEKQALTPWYTQWHHDIVSGSTKSWMSLCLMFVWTVILKCLRGASLSGSWAP